ncbi:MAG: RcnB family protein [Sphingomonas sp.]
MKTLSLLSLAAGAALLPAMAIAQPAPRAGGGAGVTWQGGGAMRGGGVHVGGGMRRGHVGGGVRVGGGHRGGVRVGGGAHFRGGWGGGVHIPRGHFRPGRGFPRRLARGGFIHPYWFGPQFYITNWQGYGFADPGEDQRWVRYYDDAYLIDRGGRVVDSREGLDWDQYGERWELDNGIPSYYGRNEFQPGDEDYAYVEQRGAERYADARGRHDRDDDDEGGRHARHHGRDDHRHGGRQVVEYGAVGGSMAYGAAGAGYGYGAPMPMPMGPGGPGIVYGGPGTTTAVYGGGYGYGMYAYPIIIETTTTTAGGGATYSEEIIEEVIQTRPRARRRARCNCTRPRPPAGERG